MMKGRFKSIVVMIILASFVSINAMVNPIKEKLDVLKTNLGTLQEKLQTLKSTLGTLKDRLQPETSFNEEGQEKSLLEQALEWAERKVAQEEAELLKQEHIFEEKQPLSWFEEWVNPNIPSFPKPSLPFAGFFSSSSTTTTTWQKPSAPYAIEGAGKPIDIYIKRKNPDDLPQWVKVQYTPSLAISTSQLPQIPQTGGISFDFRISINSMPNYSLSQFDPETRANFSIMSSKAFKEWFQPVLSHCLGDIIGAECIILSNYELYAYPNFIAYARSLSSYNDYILSLQEQIRTDSKFRDKTFKVYGFGHNTIYGFRYSEFHDRVKELADPIVEKRCEQSGCLTIWNKKILGIWPKSVRK